MVLDLNRRLKAERKWCRSEQTKMSHALTAISDTQCSFDVTDIVPGCDDEFPGSPLLCKHWYFDC
jgi:hypothetical protein